MVESTARIRALRSDLKELFDTLYVTRAIARGKRLELNSIFRTPRLMAHLAGELYGPKREVTVPGSPPLKLVRLSVRELGAAESSLLAFEPPRPQRKRRRLRCLVGHRFTPDIEQRFRWNLRQLFELYGIEEDYSGFDGSAVSLLEDLCDKIRRHDFCLFDNRETSAPSKPNVYIEAGMAFALRRPFVFCHYKREVWPSDFANILYVPYASYRELFQRLAASLPIFIARKLKR